MKREPVLFKDKLIYKPPGGVGDKLHQDYTWWQGFPNSLISVMVTIDQAMRENGCTTLFPGYQNDCLSAEGSFSFLDPSLINMGESSKSRVGTW